MSPSWRASLTVAALSGVYRVYVALVSPLTTPVFSEDVIPASVRTNTLLPTQPAHVAREHLSDAPWAAEATFQLSRGKGFVYFNERRRLDDENQNRMEFKPFALVWFDPRRTDNHPYTITCDAAVVEFKEKFQFARADANDNRIIGGSFDGEVRITGPDGLYVHGENFVFSEKDGIRSDSKRPVTFAYGPVAGETEQVRGHALQFEVTLAETDESLLGQDLPRIGGFQKVVLRRNVDLDIVLDDDGRAVPISIQSDDKFEYDVETLVATFNINVKVSRPTHAPGQPEQFDRLHCDRLTLTFEPRQSGRNERGAARPIDGQRLRPFASTANSVARSKTGLDLDLQLRSVRAIGREVKVTSDEHEMIAHMGDLWYDIRNRTLEMVHDEDFEDVELKFGPYLLACPQIRCTLDEHDNIRTAQCTGEGEVWQIDRETGEYELGSKWTEQLTMFPDPASEWDRLELHGDARVLHRPQSMLIVGDVLRLWFERRQEQAADNRTLNVSGLTASELAIRKVTAEQTGEAPIVMVSPKLQLETGRLEAEFADQNLATAADGGGPQGIDTLSQAGSDPAPLAVRAGEVQAAIVLDPDTEKADVARLTASHNVIITRRPTELQEAPAEPGVDSPFHVECETLALQNEKGVQSLSLRGAPARLKMPEVAEIEGNEILLNRSTNEARVDGPGTIIVFVDEDLDGNPVQGQDRELTVRWRESMHFDGLTARFRGAVHTALSASDLDCPEMEVSLNQRIDFSEDRPQTKGREIRNIVCKGGVEWKSLEWTGPRRSPPLVGIRSIKVADLFFDRSTGEFHARAPGRIDVWQKGERRIDLSPAAISRPSKTNQAGEAKEPEWAYTWVKFEGEMKGNQSRQYVELSDRVQVMHGPVKAALEAFDQDDFSENPELVKDAVWMKSDQMTVHRRSAGGEQAEDWILVTAFGNAELEGQVFRARAHSINYDQSKGLVTLHGGPAEAGIWYQEAPGQPFAENFSKTIQFWPSTGDIKIDRTSGIRFTPR